MEGDAGMAMVEPRVVKDGGQLKQRRREPRKGNQWQVDDRWAQIEGGSEAGRELRWRWQRISISDVKDHVSRPSACMKASKPDQRSHKVSVMNKSYTRRGCCMR